MKKERARTSGARKKKASATRLTSSSPAKKSLKSKAPKNSKTTTRKFKSSNPPVPKSARIQKAIRSLPSLETKSKVKKIRETPKTRAPKVLPAFHSDEMVKTRPVITELPFSYGKTNIVAMVRDPFWAYTYWDYSGETWNWMVIFRERDTGARLKLRVHRIDHKNFFDVDIPSETKNWYLELGEENASFEIELGILDSQGRFHRIALSNRIRTPRNGPSENIDPEWNLNDFELSELYKLSGGGKKPGAGSQDVSSHKRRSPSSN